MNQFRGCTVEVKGALLNDILDGMIEAHQSLRHLAKRRDPDQRAYWTAEANRMELACARLWELARKSKRRKDRGCDPPQGPLKSA